MVGGRAVRRYDGHKRAGGDAANLAEAVKRCQRERLCDRGKGCRGPVALGGEKRGGGSGLGKAMTSYFLELGAKVAITSRKLEKLEATAQELSEKTGGECFAVACDVRDYEQVEHMHKQVLDHFGPIDVLLNNAAGNFISPTENLSSNAFDTVVDIVLTGTKNCTMAFGKHWIKTKQKNVNVLNIITTYAFTGSGYVVPSATAKGGVLAMTRSVSYTHLTLPTILLV